MRDREVVHAVQVADRLEVVDVASRPVHVLVTGVVRGQVGVDPPWAIRGGDRVRNPREGCIGGPFLTKDVDDATPCVREVSRRETGIGVRALRVPPAAVELAAEESDQERSAVRTNPSGVVANVIVSFPGRDVIGSYSAVVGTFCAGDGVRTV